MWHRLNNWNNPSPFKGGKTSFTWGCQRIKMCQKPSRLGIGEKESYEISEKDAGTVTRIARLTHESATNLQTHHRYLS